MSHYTVGYHDKHNGLHEICEYADDAYNAIKQAREDLTGLKRELHYKCEIGEKGQWECIGANEYLNKTFDILDEFWQ